MSAEMSHTNRNQSMLYPTGSSSEISRWSRVAITLMLDQVQPYTQLMPDYSGKIDHDVDVIGDLIISGQMNGNLIIRHGARLHLLGQTNGDITVLSGGSLHQSGQLNGDLTCHGWADIVGQINGEIMVESGIVLVAEGVQRNTGKLSLVLDSNGQWCPSNSEISHVMPDAPRWRLNRDGSMTRVDNSI
jgi:hypothetical protein